MSRNAVIRRLAASVLIGGALTLAVTAIAKAPVPSTLTHQGRLYETVTDEAGGTRDVPVTGEHTMRFAIYDKVEPTEQDAPLWSETQTVTFTDGYYAAALGLISSLPNDLLTPSPDVPGQLQGRYLQITVDDQPPLAPLAKLGSVPYALVCDNATGDIHPSSVNVQGGSITVNSPSGPIEVISADGQWAGDPTGLQGPKGDPGDPGMQGEPGPQGPSGVVASVNAWGLGNNPLSSLNFIGPTVTVSVSLGEKVLVSGHKAVGSTAGAAGLNLNICSQPVGGGALTTADGVGMANLRVPASTRLIQTLSAELSNLSGSYNVGLCGFSSNAASWNDNGNGMVTAIVVQPGP
jgi:hypothetical protein